MNRSELVDGIANETKLPTKKAREVVDTILDEMVNALARGDGIEIRGFGSFSVRE